jgi:hypothetical protein
MHVLHCMRVQVPAASSSLCNGLQATRYLLKATPPRNSEVAQLQSRCSLHAWCTMSSKQPLLKSSSQNYLDRLGVMLAQTIAPEPRLCNQVTLGDVHRQTLYSHHPVSSPVTLQRFEVRPQTVAARGGGHLFVRPCLREETAQSLRHCRLRCPLSIPHRFSTMLHDLGIPLEDPLQSWSGLEIGRVHKS